jgi:hypothetical protein
MILLIKQIKEDMKEIDVHFVQSLGNLVSERVRCID